MRRIVEPLFWLVVFSCVGCLFFVVQDDRTAQAAQLDESQSADEETPEESYPKFIATLYNGGKVADIVEADDFDMEGVSRISFYGKNGKKIHIIDGRVVIRQTDPDDFAAVQKQREKTAKLRSLLNLKRQQAALEEELKEQKAIAEEMGQLERMLANEEPQAEVADDKDIDNKEVVDKKIEFGEEE